MRPVLDIHIENPANSDWTKRSWDLPPYDTPEFHAALRAIGMTLEHFKTLPIYRWAVARGEIIEPEEVAT